MFVMLFIAASANDADRLRQYLTRFGLDRKALRKAAVSSSAR